MFTKHKIVKVIVTKEEMRLVQERKAILNLEIICKPLIIDPWNFDFTTLESHPQLIIPYYQVISILMEHLKKKSSSFQRTY